MYRIFGGSFHAPHTHFPNYSRMSNNRRNLRLIRAMDVRFAGYFYSIHSCLRCMRPLKATLHAALWANLNNKKAMLVGASADVDSNLY